MTTDTPSNRQGQVMHAGHFTCLNTVCPRPRRVGGSMGSSVCLWRGERGVSGWVGG